MNYYFVIHDVPSFLLHNNKIGKKSAKITAVFKKLNPGDKIVYYCKEDQVITGTFSVESKARIVENGMKWGDGPHIVVPLKPETKAKPPYYVPANQMLQEIPEPLSLFPHRKLEGIKLKGQTILKITSNDFNQINKYIPSYKPQKLFQGPANDAGLGKPRDYKVMNYAPTSEQGVVALFIGHMKALGFENLEFIRQGFPDACAIKRSGSTYERKYIEFEYRSSGFRQHVNNPRHRNLRCDYVICWEHNYWTCPIDVIELKSKMEDII
jgi:hypothetical protein